jgi:hypothetical protein
MYASVTPSLTVSDDASIASHTAGRGRGGALRFELGSLTLADASIQSSNAALSAAGEPAGETGPVFISVGGAASLRGSAGILSHNQSPAAGGGIALSADSLELRDHGYIATQTLGHGAGGSVVVDVRRFSLIGGAGTPMIHTRAAAAGAAGGIAIIARETMNAVDSTIQSATSGSGAAGDITIAAPDLALSHSAIESLTSAGGNAGTVAIESARVTLSNGARAVSASGGLNPQTGAIDAGSGAAGDVVVNALEYVTLSGHGSDATGFYSQTLGTGPAGRVIVKTPRLLVEDGARIHAGTSGAGDGLVRLEVNELALADDSAVSSAHALVLVIGNAGGAPVLIAATGDATLTDGSGTGGAAPGGAIPDHALDLYARSVLVDGIEIDPTRATVSGGGVAIVAGDALINIFSDAIDVREGLPGGSLHLLAPHVGQSNQGALPPVPEAPTGAIAAEPVVLALSAAASPEPTPPAPAPTPPAPAPTPPAPAPTPPAPAPTPPASVPGNGAAAPQDNTPPPLRFPVSLTAVLVEPGTESHLELLGPEAARPATQGSGQAQFLNHAPLFTGACARAGAAGHPASFVVSGQGGFPRAPGDSRLASFLDLDGGGLWPAAQSGAPLAMLQRCPPF